MSSHTPGPWTAGPFEVSSQNKIICYRSGNANAPYQWPADASLISAAPDLLEALTSILNEYDKPMNEISAQVWLDKLEAARTAIKKATGSEYPSKGHDTNPPLHRIAEVPYFDRNLDTPYFVGMPDSIEDVPDGADPEDHAEKTLDEYWAAQSKEYDP